MHVVRKLIPLAAVALAIVALPNISYATPLSIGEPWGEFAFDGVGSTSACVSCIPSDGGNSFFLGAPPWTFIGPGFLIVQDAFLRGDRFEVFDNAVSMGLTSDPDTSGGCGSDPTVCFADSGSSHRVFSLADMFHSFTINVVQAPFGAGAAYLCIDSGAGECGVPLDGDQDIPEPMSMILLALGVAGTFVWIERPRLRQIIVRLRDKRERR